MTYLFYILGAALLAAVAYNVYRQRKKPKQYRLNTSRVLTRQELLTQISSKYKLKSSPLAIYAIRIDRFAGIKSKFGEDIARQVTAEVGRRIQNHAKDKGGQLAHTQLHEFCLIITDLDTHHAQTVGANLCQIINDKKLPIMNHQISVSISIGCVYSARNHADLSELVTESVLLMQSASEQGRNHFEYSDMSDVAAL